MTEPLFIAANKYQIESLKKWCSLILAKKKLYVVVAVRLLILSHLNSVKHLKGCILCFFANNAAVLWEHKEFKQLVQWCPELFFESTKYMFQELTTTFKKEMKGREERRGERVFASPPDDCD